MAVALVTLNRVTSMVKVPLVSATELLELVSEKMTTAVRNAATTGAVLLMERALSAELVAPGATPVGVPR